MGKYFICKRTIANRYNVTYTYMGTFSIVMLIREQQPLISTNYIFVVPLTPPEVLLDKPL